jgi:hypothetical protein
MIKAMAKGTRTEKKLREEKIHEQIDQIQSQYVTQIVKQHACPRASCIDNGMPCIVIEEQHVKLLYTEVVTWSKKIGLGQATVAKPHDSLM